MRRKYELGKKPSKVVPSSVLVAVVCLLGFAVMCGVVSNRFNPSAPEIVQATRKVVPSVASPTDTANINPSRPVRIQIPRIGVDAKIDLLGLTKAGDMASPKNISNAGWYKLGAMPGNEGSAVVAGHRTGLKGVPGIFIDLDKLQKGDNIIIIDEQKQSIRFVVQKIREYKLNEKPEEVFTSSNGAHLNLITCTGSWSSANNSFSERLVVFADKAL
ncbi:MAG: class F sortase [bacterium]|nr:class F sortase [bacterium]